jgi:hypothetical protein
MKTKTTYGISFPQPELLEAAKLRSKAVGLSFSAYVNQLLRRDLGRATLYQQPAPPLEVVEEPQARYGAKAKARRRASAAKKPKA